MPVTDVEINQMKEYVARQLVQLLMERKSLTMIEAFDVLYNSDTYNKLSDTSTGLYYQSPRYVYAYLDREMTQGRL